MKSKLFKGTSTYLLDSSLSEAFQIARLLEKPLLLEGEPGTGKTKLAQEFASNEKCPIFEVPITSESKVSLLVSRFDEVQRLMDAQASVANAQMKQAGINMQIDTGGRKVNDLGQYVHLGPLAKAFSTPGSILLLDEIDKAPRELPNNLLFLLSERKIIIPETQQIISCKPGEMPIIVITSNHEQDLPAPFIRRCIYMYIEFPSPVRMKEIIHMHHPGANKKIVAAAIEIFYQLRELDLNRKPSTSEILDWISYLVRTNVVDSKVVEKLKGAQTLIKHRDDREILKTIQEKGINSATSQKSSTW